MRDRLLKILSHREKQHLSPKGLTASAVLVPLYQKDNKTCILFTKRTETVMAHKGQTSFPGGSCEPEDKSTQDTALRESYEEIGLAPEDVDVLGELDDTITHNTGYIIFPVVGFIPYPYQFRLSADEVEEIVEIPLEALQDKRNFREEVEEYEGKLCPAYFCNYEEQAIWGATARIIHNLVEILSE